MNDECKRRTQEGDEKILCPSASPGIDRSGGGVGGDDWMGKGENGGFWWWGGEIGDGDGGGGGVVD